MIKYIPEVLDEIQNDPSVIERYKDHLGFTILMKYAFDPSLKMNLPKGTPPFKPDPAPLGMTPTNLIAQVRRFYIFNRKDLPKARMEQLFVQLLEGIHPSEASIVVAAKDQNIPGLYPNITRELLEKHGIIPPLPVQETEVAEKAPTKSEEVSPDVVTPQEGKHIRIELVDSAGSTESFGPSPDAETADLDGEPTKKKVGRPKKK